MSHAADPFVPTAPTAFPRLDRLLAWITEVPAAASQPDVVTTHRHSSEAASISARTPVTVGGASCV